VENETKKPVTELSFLLDLLLNHKLTLPTKNYIKDRIAEVESGYSAPARQARPVQAQVSVPVEAQNPAVQAALAQRQSLLQTAMMDPDKLPKKNRF
jgi:hypothetical protein